MPIENLSLVLAWGGRDGSTEPRLKLEFRRADERGASSHPEGLIAGGLSLATPSATWASRFLCFGHDLQEFASQLERLHRTVEGRAVFANSEGTLSLTIASAIPSRGRLAVGGAVEILGVGESRTDAGLVGVLPYAGLAVRFDGLAWEQSYLPEAIRAIRAFLKDTNCSTSSPWLCASRDP
jgi:hypothetical protein